MHAEENQVALKTAHRIYQICGQIFRYAVTTGRATIIVLLR